MQADDRVSVQDHHHSLFLNNTVLVSHREIHPVLLSACLVDVYTERRNMKYVLCCIGGNTVLAWGSSVLRW